MLSTRNTYTALGRIHPTGGDSPTYDTLRNIARAHPLSDYYRNPIKGSNAKALVGAMVALQMRDFGETILDSLPFVALERNIKLLIQEFSLEQVRQGIALASYYAKNPYSTKFVKDQIVWVMDLKRS